jgi:hypothetical protein
MNVLLGILLFFITLSYAQTADIEKKIVYEYSDNDIVSNSWINDYFLIKRIFLYPILINHIDDLDISPQQLDTIRTFYRENLYTMIEKARKVKEYQDELYDLILHGGETKKIKELIIEIAKLKAELTAYNVKEIRTIQNTLSTDQYETLLEYINQNE